MKKIIVSINTKGDEALLPRDIRNYIGSIVDEKYKDIVMWHQNSTPLFLYERPSTKFFAIHTYSLEHDEVVEHIVGKILMNPSLSIRGIQAQVESLKVLEGKDLQLQEGMFHYKTSSPLILAIDKKGIHEGIDEIIEKDDKSLQGEYLTRVIASCMEKYILDWYGFEANVSENLKIRVNGLRFFPVSYKESDGSTKRFTACHGSFVSNIELPKFMGYKIGLGYGDLMNANSKRKKQKQEETA